MDKKRAIPEGYMTVGELAGKMGTTVRTLQYYDREGLLSPSSESEGGRRLYTYKDMIRLHQIQALKSLGFSLGDIKNRLISLDTPEEVAEALTGQAGKRYGSCSLSVSSNNLLILPPFSIPFLKREFMFYLILFLQ